MHSDKPARTAANARKARRFWAWMLGALLIVVLLVVARTSLGRGDSLWRRCGIVGKLAVKTGTVQHLNTARIETKSGIRATSEQAIEYTAVTDVSMNDKDEPTFKQQMREVGLHIGFEPDRRA